MEEKQLYVIPKEIEDDLSRLVPYKGSEEITDPIEYILNYINIGAPSTFYNDGELQCRSGRNRSFLDLYFLTKAKFPEITLSEFAKIFLELHEVPYGNRFKIIVYVCGNIQKPVLYMGYSIYGGALSISTVEHMEKYLFRSTYTDITIAQIFDLVGLDYYHFIKE